MKKDIYIDPPEENIGLTGRISSQADNEEEWPDDEDRFTPCSNCDGHEACEDFGCAFKLGVGHLVKQPPGSEV